MYRVHAYRQEASKMRENNPPSEAGGATIRPACTFRLTLAVVVLSLASTTHAVDIPSPPDQPVAVSGGAIEGDAPPLVDIVAMLREEFPAVRADATVIAQTVLSAATHYDVSPLLLLAVIATESNFDRRAVSAVGAQGLMQILPAAHPRLIAGVRDLSDPAINVRIGSSILRDYIDAADGDLEAALSRYSGGAKGYARRVVLRMRRFAASLHSAPDTVVRTAFNDAR
jgi:soluble lytic murein transglycosylase-like protein